MKRSVYIWSNNPEKRELLIKYLNLNNPNIIDITIIFEDILFINESFERYNELFNYNHVFAQFSNELKTDLSILYVNHGIFSNINNIIKEFFLNTYCKVYDAGGLVYYCFVTNDELELIDQFYEFFARVDEELSKTIFVFLDNNLNITQTSKDLYIHRNTLNYRLNKFELLTGINIRTLQSASMIHSYRIRYNDRFIK
ncbi:MAG: helix-turn-helix domain-containing protein [Bacilli bacterium]|jgi:hypothetical protein|nr:helix-turn-helix domain-containing protein [Bacilli bacterium]